MLVAINLDIDLESIFVTALEGGSNYWIDFSPSTFKHLKDKYSQMSFSERVYNEFIGGAVIDVLDVEGDESDVIGQNPSIMKSDRQPKDFYKEMWQEIEQKGMWQGEIWNRRKNGEEYLQWLNISAVKDDTGEVVRYVGTFTDITSEYQKKTGAIPVMTT